MPKFRALVPVKQFNRAKTRLRPPLDDAQCETLARCMLADVLRALRATEAIASVTLLGDPDTLADTGCTVIADRGDLSRALDHAAARLAAEGAEALLVLPSDLPTLGVAAVHELLQLHTHGVTICRAASDGGTNALVLTPPDALPFGFGPDSARRHQAGALERGLEARVLDLPAFARDIDTPEDLAWLLDQRIASATGAWLHASGLRAKLRTSNTRATA